MQIHGSVVMILATLSAPGMTQAVQIGPGRYAVTLPRAELRPDMPGLAGRALDRIDRAAMATCGAFGGSLPVVTKAVRASGCWREAVDDAVRRIDALPLTHAWQARR